MNKFWQGFEKQASKLNFQILDKIRKNMKVRLKGFSRKSIKNTRAGRSIR